MKWIVGIDIGGTKISIVLGSLNGKIVEKHILATRHDLYARTSIKEIITPLRRY